jgi:hypothetical protein
VPPYNVVVTPSPATCAAVRSTAVFVEPSRRLPKISSRCSDRFMLMGVTLDVRVTPTTIVPLSERSDPARLAALRAGDERAFAELVDELSPRMLKLARVYVTGSAIAEEAVQEAWIVVLERLDRFEGRSSLSTWVLGIVVNVARARGRHESRSRPFSSLSTDDEPVIDPGAFYHRITTAGQVIGRSHPRRGPSRRSRPLRPSGSSARPSPRCRRRSGP